LVSLAGVSYKGSHLSLSSFNSSLNHYFSSVANQYQPVYRKVQMTVQCQYQCCGCGTGIQAFFDPPDLDPASYIPDSGSLSRLPDTSGTKVSRIRDEIIPYPQHSPLCRCLSDRRKSGRLTMAPYPEKEYRYLNRCESRQWTDIMASEVLIFLCHVPILYGVQTLVRIY
jgi:hypothetical protein